MADHPRLERALVEMAHLLIGDFAVADVLERLCEHAANIVPLFGAGVAVHGPDQVRVLATVGPNSAELEDLQVRLNEGPCRDAVGQGHLVRAQFPDPGDDRWPKYSDEAFRLGVRSLAALPLRAQNRTWGALDVYTDTGVPFSPDDLRALQVLADAASAYVVAAWDRDQRQRAESQLRFQALHDPLTGLPNRMLFSDRLSHALTGLARRPGAVGVLFVDLDRFKQVNDVYGHGTGDRLLIAVARRLENALRTSDSLGRFGGDEFLVLCESLKAGEDLLLVAKRVLATLEQPFHMPEGELAVRCSVGAVIANKDDSSESILRDADRAMYDAKARGGGVVISDRHLDPGMAEAIRTEVELQTAVSRQEIKVFYQPVIELAHEKVAGFEALARWYHPRRGLLSAGEFVPLAEMTGLIVPLGLSVLRQACDTLAGADQGDGHVSIAINLSGRELREPHIVERMVEILTLANTDPGRLIVEVTESSLIRRGEGLEELRALADLGLQIAIDDFGTGWSTLAYLTDLPANVVKLDKVFIGRVGAEAKHDNLVRSMIALAHELGMLVVAEGIETNEQHEFVRSANCDFGQGYFYGHPMATPVY